MCGTCKFWCETLKNVGKERIGICLYEFELPYAWRKTKKIFVETHYDEGSSCDCYQILKKEKI